MNSINNSPREGYTGSPRMDYIDELTINPREYFDNILRRMMSHPHNRLHELLPENWVKSKNS